MARRKILGALVAAIAAALLLPAAAASAEPTPVAKSGHTVNYVNLGDSFSSASGVWPIAPGTKIDCWQSNDNFAHIVARTHGYRLTDVSCGGADTGDFYTAQYPGLRPQLAALSKHTDLVTFAIGGNDGKVFGNTVRKCVQAGVSTGMTGSPCRAQREKTVLREIRTRSYPKLVRAMRAIRAKAPNARVLMLNYPWIAPNRVQSCPAMAIAPRDIKFTHEVQVELHDALTRAAKKVGGITIVDVAAASVGHDACAAPGRRWIAPLLSTEQLVPVHPNALGARMMAKVTSRALRR